jgi:molybdate transport system ATP-binding protein
VKHTGTTGHGQLGISSRAIGAVPASMLQVSVQKRLGDVQIDVAFASSGRATALFGPSGSGKTSVLNMIAGLIKPDDGRIALGDVVLYDHARRLAVPVHKRRIGYVFQEHRLFPHMNVKKNLDYGRRMNGLKYDPDEELRVLAMLGIDHLVDRRLSGLSGGEKQRIAIGRALLLKPRLLLLDEPMSSLDRKRKAELMPFLERLRDKAGVPTVYVSHAMDEVERLADTIVHMEDGKVTKVDANGRT